MLTGALQLEEMGAALTFTDNDQIGAWAKQAIAQAVQAGIIDGYGDGSFRPNAQVTRAEMAGMVARALKLPLKANTATGFVDDQAIPQWAKGSVEAIRVLGIVSGREGNKFAPNNTTTRAEAATDYFASDAGHAKIKRKTTRSVLERDSSRCFFSRPTCD